ncbi:MAG: ATP-binding protein [Burkholderiaceae bacterium]
MRRFDTLFSRLLAVQALTATALVLLFGVLFYVERNITVARLVAERWAPSLHAALGGEPADRLAPALPVLRAAELPAGSVHPRHWAPRVQTLVDSLRAGGVPVDDLAYTRTAGNPLVWVGVRGADGRHQWLGIADELIEPRLPLRFTLAVLVGVAVVALASWWAARRLTAPLRQLQARIEAHDPAAPDTPGAAPGTAPPARGATAELAAIAQAWQGMRDRLARHERERRLLLAGVSHDLRSPLARIRMAAELLPDDAAVAARRDAIVRNVDVADRLVQGFVDQVRAAELPLDETVDLAALARSVVDVFARSAADTPARPAGALRADAPASLPLARANRLLLERVMLNLVDNAFQHGRPPVTLRVAAQGAEAWVEVEDAGDGIAPAQREPLLQAFARGDPARGTPGTGLGLAVVAQVAARLGGRVVFDGGAGAHRVRVVLPRQGRLRG